MELTAFHSSVLKKIEIGGFVFTKRQPLQQQQPSNLDYSKSNRGMNTDIIAEKNRERNNENSTGEQYAAMDEMMNEHDNPATSTPTTSSRTMRRSSLGLRGKRAVNGAYRKRIIDSYCILNSVFCVASPHQSIPPCNFYTLIDAELSDPLRMKQLLTWCASKTMEDFPFEKKSPVDAVGMGFCPNKLTTSNSFSCSSSSFGSKTSIGSIEKQGFKYLLVPKRGLCLLIPESLDSLTSDSIPNLRLSSTTILKSLIQTTLKMPKKSPNSKSSFYSKAFLTTVERINKKPFRRLEDELKEWSQIKKNHQDEHAKHLDQYDPLSLNRDSICSMVDRDFASLLHSIDSACQESDDLVKDFNQNTQFKVNHRNNDDFVTFLVAIRFMLYNTCFINLMLTQMI